MSEIVGGFVVAFWVLVTIAFPRKRRARHGKNLGSFGGQRLGCLRVSTVFKMLIYVPREDQFSEEQTRNRKTEFAYFGRRV